MNTRTVSVHSIGSQVGHGAWPFQRPKFRFHPVPRDIPYELIPYQLYSHHTVPVPVALKLRLRRRTKGVSLTLGFASGRLDGE